MPGGSYKAYKYIEDILLKVAAQVTDSGPTLAREDPVFSEWNNEDLLCFLIEITADIFGIKDDKGEGYLVDKVLDKTGMKGTGKWTVQQAAELSVAAPTIAVSPDSRFLGGLKDERIEAAKVFTSRGHGGVMADVAIDKNNIKSWDLKLGELARIWKGGCIIHAVFPDRIKKAYD
ncbi:hypothetical protein GOBAR_DD30820 [Gossypium barbadense]|nr:hypothetical protein GOBAR_DD30820 [Gossypium barbadense]